MKSSIYRAILVTVLVGSAHVFAIPLDPMPDYPIDPVNVDLDAPDLECHEIPGAIQNLSTMSAAANAQANQFMAHMSASLRSWHTALSAIDPRSCEAMQEEGFGQLDFLSTRLGEMVFWASESTKARLELLIDWQLHLPGCLDQDSDGHDAACEKMHAAKDEYFERIMAEDGGLTYSIDNVANVFSEKVMLYASYKCEAMPEEDFAPMTQFYTQAADTSILISENLSNLSAEYDRITRSLDNCL